jgi:hypothetical protein
MTGPDDSGTRYHDWLDERSHGRLPPDVLPRVFAEIQRDPSQQRSLLALNRAWIAAPAFAVVAAVVIAAVIMLSPPNSTRPMAEATGSVDPTTPGWGSGTPAASASAPDLGPSETQLPSQTDVPLPTPGATPTPLPTPTPVPIPVPGTITVRLDVDTLPADTAYFAVFVMNGWDYADPEGMSPGLDQWSTWYFCGQGVHPVWPYDRQGSDPSPCARGATYEQRFTGMERTAAVWFAFERVTTAGLVEPITVVSHVADGSLLAFAYPADVHRTPAPGPSASPPADCVNHGDQRGPSLLWVGGVSSAGTFTWDAVTSASLCANLVEIWPVLGVPNIGTVTLRVDGTPVWTLQFADYLSVGTEGAGSGERVIPLGAPIPIAAGQRLSLSFSGCPGLLGNIGVWVNGYPPGV